MSFNANCNCRDEPESLVGNRVLVIRPKVGASDHGAWLAEIGVVEQVEYLGAELTRKLSVMLVFLSTEKSTFWKPGPITTLRPRLPK